ncbi:MAG: NADPH-dependent 7-cyano-7-deazaguanine reductase QueF [Chloroflexi bacterium]|nr:NADPH-dependent 7-cyano-7-deazaguanine reductase QueF [Chloroflexota bacterium]
MLADKYAARRYDAEGLSKIDAPVLECIPFEFPGSASDVTYETNEFTSVCPWTGLPDFARLTITYRPSDRLVELKSLKYYLTSYRNVGILQEHAVNRVLTDLVALLAPDYMVVEGFYNERGGISTHVRAQFPAER